MKAELDGNSIEVYFQDFASVAEEYNRYLVSSRIALRLDRELDAGEEDDFFINLHLPDGMPTISSKAHILKIRRHDDSTEVLLTIDRLSKDDFELLQQAVDRGNMDEHLQSATHANDAEQDSILDGYSGLDRENLSEFLQQVSIAELSFHCERMHQLCVALISKGRTSEAAKLVSQLGRFTKRANSEERSKMVSEVLFECSAADVMNALVAAALEARTEDASDYAEALAALGNDALPYLFKLVELSSDTRARLKAIDAIVAAGEVAIPIIKEELKRREIKWYYLRNLLLIAGKIEATDALSVIEQHLADENAAVRAEALAALVRIKGRPAIHTAENFLQDSSLVVVRTAVHMFAEIGVFTEAARKFFESVLRRFPDVDDELIIEVLRSITALSKQAKQTDRALIRLLEKLAPPGLIARLVLGKDNRPTGVLLGTIAALGAVGTSRAIRALRRQLKKESDPWYQAAIREALSRAGDKHHAK